jgi:ATP-dependent Clp protease adapter protein ClpS
MTKEYVVFIDEIRQHVVTGERFSGPYTKTLNLSDGSYRTISLTPVVRNDREVVQVVDSEKIGYLTRNSSFTIESLMVQIYEVGSFLDLTSIEHIRVASALDLASHSVPGKMVYWNTSLVVDLPEFSQFRHGLELLDDDQTPMQFVVESLAKVLGLERKSAIHIMLVIHKSGRAIIAVPTAQEAESACQDIVAEARASGYPLVCRVIGGAAPAAPGDP